MIFSKLEQAWKFYNFARDWSPIIEHTQAIFTRMLESLNFYFKKEKKLPIRNLAMSFSFMLEESILRSKHLKAFGAPKEALRNLLQYKMNAGQENGSIYTHITISKKKSQGHDKHEITNIL